MLLKIPVLVGLDVREASIDAKVTVGSGVFQVFGSYPETERTIPEHTLRESRVRVLAALTERGVYVVGFVEVRLPSGASLADLDLAIALACLEAVGLVELPAGIMPRAALQLNGVLSPVRGCFAALVAAERVSVAVVSRHDRQEAEASGKPYLAHECLADVMNAFPRRTPKPFEPMATRAEFHGKAFRGDAPEKVKAAALEGRSILIQGRPGSGRVMLSRYYHSLMTLTESQAVEVMKVQSAGCVLDADRFRVPYRAPHHSVSAAGMLGGGIGLLPGEVSLAHHGLLVLDELPEFKAAVLSGVRLAQKDGFVIVAREGTSALFPANFRIVATADLCPRNCHAACDCPGPSLERYRERLALLGDLEVIRLP